jgi:hypothetical protein
MVDMTRLSEQISHEAVGWFLGCLIIEYAEAVKQLHEHQPSVEFFTRLREMAIECFERYFSQSGVVLADLRLANPQTDLYVELFNKTMLFRSWLAGRYIQLRVDERVFGVTDDKRPEVRPNE